jgi:hypothetical protein
VCLLARTLPSAAFPNALDAPQLSFLAHNDLTHLAAQLLLLAQVYCCQQVLRDEESEVRGCDE